MTERSLLLLLAIPFSLAACSSDSFTAPDDAGGADAAADSPVADAGADTLSDAVAPPPDAGGDAAAVDAGWVPPAPLVCANAPSDAIFCADFDTNGDPAAGWTSTFKINGDVTSDLANFYSSARAAKTAAFGNPPSYGTLYKNSTDTTHVRFVLSFAFRVDNVDTAAGVRVGRFEYPPDTGPFGSVGFDVVVGPGLSVALSVSTPSGDAGVSTSSVNLGNYTKGAWHHVVLNVKTKAPVAVEASFDAAKQTFNPNIPGTGSSFGNRDIFLGARAVTSMASTATIQIDDVLLRAL
jgi:hypothetical protein